VILRRFAIGVFFFTELGYDGGMKRCAGFRAGVFFGLLFLFSCRAERELSVALKGGGSFLREAAFLGEVFRENGGLERLNLRFSSEFSPAAAIVLELGASWTPPGEGRVVVSKTWMIPREDPLTGRISADVAACLGGEEVLVPLEELGPPHTGLRVEGLSAADEGYPLVQYVWVKVREAEEGEKNGKRRRRRVLEGMAALEQGLEEMPKPLTAEPPEIVWIGAAGDLMLGRGAEDILIREGPRGVFGGAAELFAASDLVMVNLEGAVTTGGSRTKKAYNFRFQPFVAAALREAGIDAALLANNHIFDYGERGFLDTLTHLQNAGIAALGAGTAIDEAAEPFVFQQGTAKIRVFGIASFPRERSGWDGGSVAAGPDRGGILFARRGGLEKLAAGVEGSAAGDLGVIFFHGGNEWSFHPDGDTRKLYTDLVRRGADLIIGSHPHVVQGFEWVLGKPVFWSLGNFVFAGMEDTAGGEEGLFIRLGFAGKKLVYLEPSALRLRGPLTDIAGPEGLEGFYRLSRTLRDRQPEEEQ
jgi:poly-gamma-glutamate synthesis protein (capsule biosynthesis protein)